MTIGASTNVIRTALWDDVRVADDVRLVDCIVCDGVRLPRGAAYERCAIVPAHGASPLPGDLIDGDLLVRPI